MIEEDRDATAVTAGEQLSQHCRLSRPLGTADDREWDSLMTTTCEHESIHRTSPVYTTSRGCGFANRREASRRTKHLLNWPKSQRRATDPFVTQLLRSTPMGPWSNRNDFVDANASEVATVAPNRVASSRAV